jgi:exodeoxyribonuclease X
MKKGNELIFLDVETTGVNDDDRLIQVAYKFHQSENSFVEYFKPPKNISIDAMSICHITNEMVAQKPPFEQSDMCLFLKAELEEEPSILVAHNAAFDMKFLQREGINPVQHICTMKLAYKLDKKAEFEKYNLQYLRYYFKLKGLENINPHDALSDVLVLEALFEQVFLKVFTVEEMVQISSEPILYQKWMFGKHKGEYFKDVARKDLDYLLWFRRVGDCDENMLYTLNYWINNRN